MLPNSVPCAAGVDLCTLQLLCPPPELDSISRAAVLHICALRCSVASLRFTAHRMLQYNLGALGWQLPPDDMAQLSSIGTQIKYFDGEGDKPTAMCLWNARSRSCLLSAPVLGCNMLSCANKYPSGNYQLQPALLQVSSAPMVRSGIMRSCGMSSALMQSSLLQQTLVQDAAE